ncbi:MAG: WD40 repeat domain-containing protein, partial [Ardenticatenaceae bacterium]
AKEGEVTIANGGDIAKELEALPADALTPNKLVDLPSLTSTLFHHPGITRMTWANDHTLAVAAPDGIWLYDTNALDSAPILLSGSACQFYDNSCVTALTISDNGEWLAAFLAGHPSSLLLWSLTSLGEPKVLTDYSITSFFAISPNGKSVAFVGAHDSFRSYDIQIWDVASGDVNQILNFLDAKSKQVTGLTFRSDGAVVMAGIQKPVNSPYNLQGEGTIRRFHVSNGEEMDALSVQAPIAFSQDGQTAATKGADSLQLWDLSSEAVTSREFGAPLSPDSNLSHLTFSQDGSKLAATVGLPSNVFNIEVWDVSTESQLGTLRTRELTAWSPSGRFAVFSDLFTTKDDCWLWDVTQNERLDTLARRCPFQITFSPNDRSLASTNRSLLQLSGLE